MPTSVKRKKVGLPHYDERRGWIGGDSRTLYALTDRRTGRVAVHPGGGGPGKKLLTYMGPEAQVRVATREEGEEHWQRPLPAGWNVLDSSTHHATKKYGPKAAEKVERAMHEFKRGTLRSGSGGKVTSREQAIAIGLAQARRAGGKVPRAPSHAMKRALPYDQHTYEEALGWEPARIERELAAISAYMTEHWAGMSEANKQILLRERKAIQDARRAQLRAGSAHATRKKSPAELDREIVAVLSRSSRRADHATIKYDRDDARSFGRYAWRMEQTKAQALANARAEGFAPHQLAAVEEGWEGERRDTRYGGFGGFGG